MAYAWALTPAKFAGTSEGALLRRTSIFWACLCALSVPAAAQDINTFPSWDGINFLTPWGPSAFATYGQTITPSGGQTRLQSFTFALQLNGGVPPEYQAFVYQWNTATQRISGPAIFASGQLTAPNNSANFANVTVNTGGVVLTAGLQYVLFFTTSTSTNLNASNYRWGAPNSVNSTYSGGQIVFMNNGTNFAQLSSSAWSTVSRDFAFVARFLGFNLPFVGNTGNQQTVGNSLQDASLGTGSANGTAVLNALSGLPSDDATRAALDALSGEGVTGAQQMAFNSVNLFGSTVASQMEFWRQDGGLQQVSGVTFTSPSYLGGTAKAPRNYDTASFRFWATGYGGNAHIGGEASAVGSANLSTFTQGLASGLNYQVSRNTLIGVALGASTSGFSVQDRMTKGSADGFHVGVYGMQKFGGVYVSGTADYVHFDNETNRFVAGIGPIEVAKGKFSSDVLTGKIEAGARSRFGGVNVTPFASIQAAYLTSGDFLENSTVLGGGGAGILGLAVGSHSVTSLPASLGIAFDSKMPIGSGMSLIPFGRVAWVHEFNTRRTIDASLISLPTAAFSVEGARPTADTAKITVGVRLEVGNNVDLFTKFDGEFSGHTGSVAGTGGLKVTW